EYRNVVNERNAALRVVLSGLENPGDDGRSAVTHHQLRLRLTCIEWRSGGTDDGQTGRRLGLLHRDVHDHRSRFRDLRRDLQLQSRVQVGDRGGEVDPRLIRDLYAAHDRGRGVVLRGDPRRRNDLDEALR